jgi:hypothetical protein
MEYDIGGFLCLPGREDITKYCLKCALDEVKAFYKTEKLKAVIIRKKDLEGDN